MNDSMLRNLLIYACLWLTNALVLCLAAALAAGNVPGFGDGGFFAPVAVPLGAALAAIGSALAMVLAANRPKLGREEISQLVSEVGAIDARAILRDAIHGNRQTTVMADIELVRMADLVFERIAARMREQRG